MNLLNQSIVSTRQIKFFLPFVLAILGLIIIYFVVDAIIFGKLFFLMIIYFIPPLGKESLIPIGISGGEITVPFTNNVVFIPPIDPFIMAVCIAFVDIMVALFLVWNLDFVKKIPIVGDVVVKIERAGKSSSSKYQWIKPLEFIGIVLFVIIPFQGSGGFFGSVVGRVIGMKPWSVFLAIFIGSFMSTFLVAYFASALFSLLSTNLLQGVLLIIIVIIIVLIIMFYRKNNKKRRNKS